MTMSTRLKPEDAPKVLDKQWFDAITAAMPSSGAFMSGQDKHGTVAAYLLGIQHAINAFRVIIKE
nr:MAG TPA: hypothetical protein [Caudoviricetes sp.]